jgi:hypothetical protein
MLIEVLNMKTFQVIPGGIVFQLQPEPDEGYAITVLSLPGCIPRLNLLECFGKDKKTLLKAGCSHRRRHTNT